VTTADDLARARAALMDALFGEAPNGQARAFAVLAADPSPSMLMQARRLFGHASAPAHGAARPDGALLAEWMRRRWGESYLRPLATLAGLREAVTVPLTVAPLARWIAAVRPGGAGPRWLLGSSWGQVATAYVSDLQQLERLYARERSTWERRQVAAALARVTASGAEVLEPLAGTRTLVCGTHAGPYRVGYALLGERFPAAMALHAAEGARGQKAIVDPVGSLYRLVKHLRAPGGIGVIGAEGRDARSWGSATVHGLAVPVPLGPSVAAFNARAACSFILSSWRGRQVAVRLVPGPAAQGGMRLSEYQALWLAAYGRVMEQVVDGPAEDVQGSQGMWGLIRQQLAEGA
jgi:hypothetical protein